MIGITINGKHSYRDFNLTIAEEGRDIGYPSKVKRKFKPPFSNIEYDFSSVYGDQDYDNRKLKYNFNVFSKENPTKNKMTWEKIAAQNWLYNTNGKIRIEDDLIEGYYFLGELEDGASFDEMWQSGVLTVEFECYPFMTDELPEGNNLWKTFNFHTDMLQETKFTINGSRQVKLFNLGVPSINPVIDSTAEMSVLMNGKMFIIPVGKSTSDDFYLSTGVNSLTITGNGEITFTFYKELI